MDKVETTSARWLAFALILAGLIPVAGCRICADCEDLAYPAYGGAWQRTRRNDGRVGSLFDPAGARASDLASRDEPPKPDALERDRQESRGSKITDPEEQAEEAKPDEDRIRDFESKEGDLQDRELDDIEEKNEEELRKKNLDDINVRLLPGQPMPPVLQ